MTLSETQESDEEGILPPHSPLLSPRDPRMLRSPSELVPPLFRPKLRPCSPALISAVTGELGPVGLGLGLCLLACFSELETVYLS